ncbi:MAG: DEAD/DEAH box helicase family protein [Kosmotoga sp.]|uniref:DISARM system SNF2-like helicase DrmD n=1 Tax=Kosmotoga sp. TaxID=1955248 RepID=UPI001D4B9A34|nr:DISARM system SNF2-like helicase DrmD [Kosmotoga sp.]MBO8167324.1 DEAD/DEAH box helicase family protein [Kosmotoga sp.]
MLSGGGGISIYASTNPPEPGKLARVRGKYWLIEEVSCNEELFGDKNNCTLVTLESLEDSNLGKKLSVVMEREVDFEIFEESILPEITNTMDRPDVFDSFINSLRWTNKFLLNNDIIRAPFYGAIKQQPFQLEPVIKALSMPRISLLIADDVGLGKTIEAGMIIQELILRGKARRVLLICPASLQLQWQWEMEQKFGLEFRIMNSKAITDIKREYGINVNPWLTYPRLIASMDFIKMEGRLNEFLKSCEITESKYIRGWDLIVVDEAHNAMPQPTKNYYRDSDRTRMLYEIGRHFEHKIFLTATPHNGRKESFVAFLDMLDPLRFNRGEDPGVNKDSFKKRLNQVMVRRMKRGEAAVKDSLGRPLFPNRKIESITVIPSEDELRCYELLNEYIKNSIKSSEIQKNRPLEFALTILKKRLLSSPRAFYKSILAHSSYIERTNNTFSYLQLLTQRLNEDWDNDIDKEQTEEELLSAVCEKKHMNILEELKIVAAKTKDRPDCKINSLIQWINDYLRPNGKWNRERVVIFTEFKDTLEYIVDQLMKNGIEKNRILQLYGGMEMNKREEIKASFETDPSDSPARILVATDAASEGINLQHHCRYMIHMEIPWNPIRLEQRNGRIDRHGQKRNIKIYHFAYKNNADSRFLSTIVRKVEQIREDINTMNPVISEKVQKHMLGLEEVSEERLTSIKSELTRELLKIRSEAAEILKKIEESREKLNITPESVRKILDTALKLNGCPGVKQTSNNYYVIEKLPDGWKSLKKYIAEDGMPKKLTFEHTDNNKIQHLHPNHPLVKRAITFFRSNIWSKALGDSSKHRLNKVTCKVLPRGISASSHVLLYARSLAVNEYSQPLVEEVNVIGGSFDQGQFIENDPEYLLSLDSKGKFDEKVSKLLPHLSGALKKNEQQILDLIEKYKKTWINNLKKELSQVTEKEIKTLKEMIKERTAEIKKVLKVLDKYKEQSTMLLSEEFEQFSEDIRLLQNRREFLSKELSEIPEKIRKKYKLHGEPVVNVVAVSFLVPEEMVVEA